MQGRNGGRLPAFIPRGCRGPWQAEEEEGGTRQMRVGGWRAGHGEGAELCLSAAGSLGLPLSHISPSVEGAAVLLPLPLVG